MSGPAPGRVFISYRRQEASGMAGRLYDRLTAHLNDDQVFMDVDTIEPGPERTVGLRKLLEAKDAIVRGKLHPGG